MRVETEIEIGLSIDEEYIARIINNEDVYIYTSVLRKDEAIVLAKKILEVMQ